jgi:hypothetical protein
MEYMKKYLKNHWKYLLKNPKSNLQPSFLPLFSQVLFSFCNLGISGPAYNLNRFEKFVNIFIKQCTICGRKFHAHWNIIVSDSKGLDQPACQERWKKCKKKEE